MITHTSDGRHVFFTVAGDGPVILFVHGAGSDADTMAGLVSELSGAYRCVSMDRLGYRRSAHLHADTTVDEQADAIEAVRKACTSDPVWLFGHSSGGNVVTGYASRFPANVRGLILMEPAFYALHPSDVSSPVIERMKSEVIPAFYESGDVADGIRRFFGALCNPSGHSRLPELARLPSSTDPEENWRPFGHNQPFVVDWRPSATDIEHLTRHPTLVLEGDRSDQLLRDICRFVIKELPTARLVTLAGCDHRRSANQAEARCRADIAVRRPRCRLSATRSSPFGTPKEVAMTRRLLTSVALVGFLLAAWLAAPLVIAQAPAPSTPSRGAAKPWKVARTPDGQPDLQGFWSNTTYVPLERPKNVTKEFYTPEEAAEMIKKAALTEKSRPSRAPSPTSTTTSHSSGWTAARARSRRTSVRRSSWIRGTGASHR